MFISVLDLFKVGIGPSSSHTMAPLRAALDFLARVKAALVTLPPAPGLHVTCILKGSLAFTGKGHSTDKAVALGLHNYTPEMLASKDIETLVEQIWEPCNIAENEGMVVTFTPGTDIVFDFGAALPQHPNGMIFQLVDQTGNVMLSETYFSIGGGFVHTLDEIEKLMDAPPPAPRIARPYAFDSAKAMLAMAAESGHSIATMKRANENRHLSDLDLNRGLDRIWSCMRRCTERGLSTSDKLPGGLNLARRAQHLCKQLDASPQPASPNDWLCAYAMAVNEENAAGHMVVTAPTNGAAGVIAALLYFLVEHEHIGSEDIRDFLLTASAIGGIIKHRSSISGAEVGCQGEVGSAAAMGAAGLCAVRGGTPRQVEHAAEMALEHHLGMTCDPVDGLVQVPCIERNGFGAIKAYAAASLALHGTGHHFIPLDSCIAAMKQTGLEMSHKFKETSLGGLAVSITEC